MMTKSRLNDMNNSTELRESFSLIAWASCPPYSTNPEICCHYIEIEPMLHVRKTKTAWLSAIHRDQSRTRAGIDVVEIDGMIRINPPYNLIHNGVWMYIHKDDLPYKPLHDQYYPSIGCWPCIASVDKGGDERGRQWQGLPKLECGTHLNNEKTG